MDGGPEDGKRRSEVKGELVANAVALGSREFGFCSSRLVATLVREPRTCTKCETTEIRESKSKNRQQEPKGSWNPLAKRCSRCCF